MDRRRFLATAAFALLLSACTTWAADAERLPPVFVMRHLDTPPGERDPDLTAQGHARALALADQLAAEGIAAIYVSDYKRTRQTAAPLAARLGLEPILYDPRDRPALLAGCGRSGGRCWSSAIRTPFPRSSKALAAPDRHRWRTRISGISGASLPEARRSSCGSTEGAATTPSGGSLET